MKTRKILLFTTIPLLLVALFLTLFLATDLFQSSTKDVTIIDYQKMTKYDKIYANLPANYFHLGNTLYYTANYSISIKKLSKELISLTHYYSAKRLTRAIKVTNGLKSDRLKKGQTIYIPYSLPPLLSNLKNNKKPKIKPIKALYITGYTASKVSFLKSLNSLKEAGINAIVFDAKDITGIVNYHSNIPFVQDLNTHKKRTIDDVNFLIRVLKENGFYTIARIAVFRDHLVYKSKPEWALHSKTTGQPWKLNSKELWLDPTNKDVQDYNIQLAIELANKGVDEIQFDYIRFPTGKNLNEINYTYSFGKMSKDQSIANFLRRAYTELNKYNVITSIDTFGIVAWGKEADIRSTGQRLELLSKYCDVISPMLYPSHFNSGFHGFDNPADNPYHFLKIGCENFQKHCPGVVIRPWLQAFKWRVTNYNEDYIISQIEGTEAGNGIGYIFWNAQNNYSVVFKALKKMNNTK